MTASIKRQGVKGNPTAGYVIQNKLLTARKQQVVGEEPWTKATSAGTATGVWSPAGCHGAVTDYEVLFMDFVVNY